MASTEVIALGTSKLFLCEPLVEMFLGVKAERRGLEDIAEPLSAAPAQS
ncbi:hypothetical protein AB0M44_06200 [Streptosporangium subroseum]